MKKKYNDINVVHDLFGPCRNPHASEIAQLVSRLYEIARKNLCGAMRHVRMA
jgi:hypothetical protein